MRSACAHAPATVDPQADTEALERKTPSSWLGRLSAVLHCHRLRCLVVILAAVLSTLCIVGWKAYGGIADRVTTCEKRDAVQASQLDTIATDVRELVNHLIRKP